MLIVQQTHMETIETETARIRSKVARWYIFGIPVFTQRAEVARKGATVSDELRRRVYEADDYMCVYCGVDSTDPKVVLSVDHRIPQIDGGLTTFENLVTACKPCNSAKCGRTPEEAMMTPWAGRYIVTP